jgi:predicted secreted protein
MSLPMALATYFICWWVVLFAVLPIGVRSQAEDGDVTPGTADGAPSAPRILHKFAITTVVATVVFAVVYAVVTFRLIPLDALPGAG